MFARTVIHKNPCGGGEDFTICFLAFPRVFSADGNWLLSLSWPFERCCCWCFSQPVWQYVLLCVNCFSLTYGFHPTLTKIKSREGCGMGVLCRILSACKLMSVIVAMIFLVQKFPLRLLRFPLFFSFWLQSQNPLVTHTWRCVSPWLQRYSNCKNSTWRLLARQVEELIRLKARLKRL